MPTVWRTTYLAASLHGRRAGQQVILSNTCRYNADRQFAAQVYPTISNGCQNRRIFLRRAFIMRRRPYYVVGALEIFSMMIWWWWELFIGILWQSEAHLSEADKNLLCPRPHSEVSNKRCFCLSVRPSVCPSVAYIANNSRTQRPSVPKFGRKVTGLWCDSRTSLKVKRSKVMVTSLINAHTHRVL